jgi:hypothetical protein
MDDIERVKILNSQKSLGGKEAKKRVNQMEKIQSLNFFKD